jgi:hypothetical protein
MRWTVAAVLLALLLTAGQRAAAEPKVITLSCDGTVHDTKDEPLQKMGVVVNLDERTVSFGGYVVPSVNVDAAYITFDYNKKQSGFESQISGDVDRVTGDMHAQAITFNDEKLLSGTNYLVHCETTRRVEQQAAAEPKVIALSYKGTTTLGTTNQAQTLQKMGVVVNLDERTVSFLGYVAPAIKVNAAIITFEGHARPM